jgi:NADPH-dependent curcumin reductase CurA
MSDPNATPVLNRQIILRNYPLGEVQASDFALQTVPVPNIGEGEVLRRTLYLSLDPFMRDRMRAHVSYAPSVALGAVVMGGTVSQVLASRHPDYQPGDIVAGEDGWQEYGVSNGTDLRKLDPAQSKITHVLGALGLPGLAAYASLREVGRPQPGETVLVSAAAGAVGSLVGQIAKIKGCRAVGLAGSEEKRRFVVENLGYDACINYREGDVAAALRATCPNGIDVYIDQVAGPLLETVLGQIAHHARIVLVGLVSQYDAATLPPGPNLLPLLLNGALLQGFLANEYRYLEAEFQQEMGQWLREGKVRYQEDIVEGLENAPEAFLRLFSGKNLGKLLVRVSNDPTAS